MHDHADPADDVGTGPTEFGLTVRWAECDAAGIIYHARVFDWFSEARVTWLAQTGLSYYTHLRPRGVELLVLATEARFHRPLGPGAKVTVRAGVTKFTPTRMTFRYLVTLDGVLAVEGATHHAFVIAGRAANLRKSAPDIYAALAAAGTLELGGPEATSTGKNRRAIHEGTVPT